MIFLRAFQRDQRGAAAAEMALILPLLLILMFGGFEVGHYFYTEHKIVKAVRDGARYAGRLPFDSYDCASGSAAREGDIRAVTRTGTVQGTTPLIPDWPAGDIRVLVDCTSIATGIFTGNGNRAAIVTVAATAPYPSLFGELGVVDPDIDVAANAQAVVNGL